MKRIPLSTKDWARLERASSIPEVTTILYTILGLYMSQSPRMIDLAKVAFDICDEELKKESEEL